ncbi:MAG: PPC domain-containing protein, partial [Bacteroidales bacterium]|nr:PPC domain-containing protein [Bacteroidales bacterium]
TSIEVIEADVSVSAPEQVVIGSEFQVAWVAEGLHQRDYVTIVPAGAEEGKYTNYHRLEGGNPGKLRAPAEPGLYEVRLQLESVGRVLASTPVEVVEGEVTVAGPERVRAGAELTVNWTGAIHPRDYITIVPAGAEDGTYKSYIRVGTASDGKLRAPEEQGLYEIRFQMEQAGRVLARQAMEVLAADAALDEGAGLVVPTTGKAGSTISVSWTGGADSADQRIALARADQADFTWISAASAIERNTLEIALPAEPGTYEIRYLDVTGRAVLGRSLIEVQP